MFLCLVLDAFREPLTLYRHILRAYWRTGIARWCRTALRFARDAACAPGLPAGSLVIAGERDPIPDRTCVDVQVVPGAHACIFSHPREVAELLERRRPAG
jgi:hypothetical protein